MSQEHECNGCLSRREYLKTVSAATLALGAGGSIFAAPEEERKPDWKEYVDPAKIVPQPKVRLLAAILRQPLPYWLGWPGTAYDVEKFSAEYLRQTRESSKKLGIDAAVEEKAVQDEAGFTALLTKAKAEKPDGLLVILQHMSCWGWADRLSKEAGVPIIIFSPIGTSFTGHVLEISRRTGAYIVSSLEWSAVEAGLRMIRAKRKFEESRILWIHGGARNETVLDRLGTKVRAIPRDTFNKLFDTVPVTEEVQATAADIRKKAQKVVEPSDKDCLNAIRVYLTAKRLLADEKANALSMDCLGMVGAKLVPTPPCGAWMMLQDQGITAGCEADLFGATSLMLTSYLFGRPGYMNDPVAETAKNLLIASHCVCGSKLDGFDKPAAPYILRSHSESNIGVSVQVLWPVGQEATLVRFTGPGEMIIDTGKVVSNIDTPPAGGCRTSIELAMDDVEDARDVLGFHQVVVLGNHKRELKSFCQLYGIRTVRSPARAPEAKG
jgi:hypothetical protein